MKINWGTGIVLAFIGFISFILYFVYRMNTDGHADHELVTEDYYEKELVYQDEIDSQKSALESGAKLQITKSEEGIYIVFPKNFDVSKISGKVSLYRPSNRHLDFDLPISLSNTHLLIPDNRLVDGRWDITVKWQYKGKFFLQKEKYTY